MGNRELSITILSLTEQLTNKDTVEGDLKLSKNFLLSG